MIHSLSSVRVGVCPTQLKFVGSLVPDGSGALPREEGGRSYDELIIDGFVEVTRSLNNLVARGVLPRG